MVKKRHRVDHDEVRRLSAKGIKDYEIAQQLRCTPGYVRLVRQGRVPLAAERKAQGIRSTSRQIQRPLQGRRPPRMPAFDDPAIMGSRTLHPELVRAPTGPMALKPGKFNAKLGDRIEKGKWKGFQIFSLTLEERATCPKSCHHWRSCFGNSMRQADRIEHGPELEAQLEAEIKALLLEYRRGIAIRLHVLGDFYSVPYVLFWERMLKNYSNLRCFGFTARWDRRHDPIAHELRRLVFHNWERFAIRFSNAPLDYKSTISIEHPCQLENHPDAIVCPEQTGKTETCGTCALCWQTTRPIAFIQH